MRSALLALCGLLLWLPLGCGPAASSSAPDQSRSAGTQAPKTLTLGALNSIKGFSPWLIGTTGGGARSLFETHINGLVTTDFQGNLEPRLAARLPSFDDGTIIVLPDGRMQTIWKLRPNIKWHDGVPFTAEDVVFSWQVNTHPEIPSGGGQARQRLDSAEVIDSSTVLITWTTTYFKALNLAFTDLWPFPKHVLGEAFQGDKEAFLNLPYWTTENIQLGAYRLADFGLGESLVLDRFDDYFRGRPRVERILIRIIPDPNTLVTNLKAGGLDLVTENALGAEVGSELREEWRQSGEGTILSKQGNWRFINVQFNPDYGRPPEVSQDVRLRRGLLAGVDREAIRDVLAPGFPNTEPDTFMPLGDPRGPLVGTPFARYRYDPGGAVRELASAGWRRDTGGRVVDASAAPVQLNLRTTAGSGRELAIVAQSWRELGLEVIEEIVPGSLVSDRAYRATFPGMEITAQGNGDSILTRFDGRQCPTPPRFSGSQGGCYANPLLDQTIDRLFASIEIRDQGLALKEIGDILAAELPALPMYFDVNVVAVRKGVRAMIDDYAGTNNPGTASRNAHLWDRD
jgi:peptide/nickel transport system substrate-binding protein